MLVDGVPSSAPSYPQYDLAVYVPRVCLPSFLKQRMRLPQSHQIREAFKAVLQCWPIPTRSGRSVRATSSGTR